MHILVPDTNGGFVFVGFTPLKPKPGHDAVIPDAEAWKLGRFVPINLEQRQLKNFPDPGITTRVLIAPNAEVASRLPGFQGAAGGPFALS